jgi:hypothetical protein
MRLALSFYFALSASIVGCGKQTTTEREKIGGKTDFNLALWSDEDLNSLLQSNSEAMNLVQDPALAGLPAELEGVLTDVRLLGQDNVLVQVGQPEGFTEVAGANATQGFALGCLNAGCATPLDIPEDVLANPAQHRNKRVRIRGGLLYPDFPRAFPFPLFFRPRLFGFLQIRPVLVEQVVGVVHCASSRYRYNSCPLPLVPHNLRLVRRHSAAGCKIGHSFGLAGNAIFVNHGCRADFEYTSLVEAGRGF